MEGRGSPSNLLRRGSTRAAALISATVRLRSRAGPEKPRILLLVWGSPLRSRKLRKATSPSTTQRSARDLPVPCDGALLRPRPRQDFQVAPGDLGTALVEDAHRRNRAARPAIKDEQRLAALAKLPAIAPLP